jgi:hypothetical protein
MPSLPPPPPATAEAATRTTAASKIARAEERLLQAAVEESLQLPVDSLKLAVSEVRTVTMPRHAVMCTVPDIMSGSRLDLHRIVTILHDQGIVLSSAVQAASPTP